MPEAMKKLTVISLKSCGLEVLEDLGELGVLHLKRVEEPEFFVFKPEELNSRQKYEDLYNRLSLLRKRLDITEMPEAEGIGEASKTELEGYVEEHERKLNDVLSRLSDERERLRDLNERRRRLRILKENNVAVSDLGKFQDKFVKAGLVSRELSSKLDNYFFQAGSLKYSIVDISPLECFVTIFGRREVEAQVTNVLSSFNFKEFTFPPSIPKNIDEAIQTVEGDLRKVKQRLETLEKGRDAVKQEVSKKLIIAEYTILKKMFQEFDIPLEKLRENLGFRSAGLEEKAEYETLFERFTRLRERLGVEETPETERPVEMSEKELTSYIDSYERRLDNFYRS